MLGEYGSMHASQQILPTQNIFLKIKIRQRISHSHKKQIYFLMTSFHDLVPIVVLLLPTFILTKVQSSKFDKLFFNCLDINWKVTDL